MVPEVVVDSIGRNLSLQAKSIVLAYFMISIGSLIEKGKRKKKRKKKKEKEKKEDLG